MPLIEVTGVPSSAELLCLEPDAASEGPIEPPTWVNPSGERFKDTLGLDELLPARGDHVGGPMGEANGPILDVGVPIVEEGGPVVEEGAPIVEEGAPIVEEGAPIVEEGGPVVEPAPVDTPGPTLVLSSSAPSTSIPSPPQSVTFTSLLTTTLGELPSMPRTPLEGQNTCVPLPRLGIRALILS
jgi:hypothetical protein